jgi:hypothetical protein
MVWLKYSLSERRDFQNLTFEDEDEPVCRLLLHIFTWISRIQYCGVERWSILPKLEYRIRTNKPMHFYRCGVMLILIVIINKRRHNKWNCIGTSLEFKSCFTPFHLIYLLEKTEKLKWANTHVDVTVLYIVLCMIRFLQLYQLDAIRFW